jgi:hypothetical protein
VLGVCASYYGRAATADAAAAAAKYALAIENFNIYARQFE